MKEDEVDKILNHLNDRGLITVCKDRLKFIVEVDALKNELLEVEIWINLNV